MPALPSQIAFALIIVQTGLADTDHFRMPRLRHHFSNVEFRRILAVGVHVYGAEDVAVVFRDGEHFGETLPTDAGGQRLPDLPRAYIDEHFGQATDQAIEI